MLYQQVRWGQRAEKDDCCHYGLGRDINKKKIRSLSLRRLRGKEKRKIPDCGSSRKRLDIWKILRCHYTKGPSEFSDVIGVMSFVCEVALLKIEGGLGLTGKVITLQKMLCIDPVACVSSFSYSLLGWVMIQKDFMLLFAKMHLFGIKWTAFEGFQLHIAFSRGKPWRHRCFLYP